MTIGSNGELEHTHYWTGPDDLNLSRLIKVAVVKGRVMFVEKDSSNVWYGGFESVRGVLTKFPLGFIHPQGGNVVDIATLTLDGGVGQDDLTCFFMSNGDMLLYQGIDIAIGGSWSKIGTFSIGKLLGDNKPIHYANDTVAITQDGIVPIQDMIARARNQNQDTKISNKIASTIAAIGERYGENRKGWQSHFFPKANWLLFNIPSDAGTGYHQYIMNSQTKAWARFIDIPAFCWHEYNDKILFGGPNGIIYEMNSGYSDDGDFINGNIETAFTYLRTAEDKNFNFAKTLLETNGNLELGLGVSTNFKRRAEIPTSGSVASSSLGWGELTWADWMWGDSEVTENKWQEVHGEGSSVSLRCSVKGKGIQLSIYSFDLLYHIRQRLTPL